jgi:hypothetical protein
MCPPDDFWCGSDDFTMMINDHGKWFREYNFVSPEVFLKTCQELDGIDRACMTEGRTRWLYFIVHGLKEGSNHASELGIVERPGV